MNSSRKNFLAVGAALAALTPLLEAPSRAEASTLVAFSKRMPLLQFDLAAFESTLGATAAHRHLFASKLVADGDVFFAISNTMAAYASLGTAFTAVYPVAVLYHAGIALAFNDNIWNEILIPLAAKLPSWISANLPAVLKPRSGNPWLHSAAGARPDDLDSIDALLAKTRLQMFVCNNALYGYAVTLSGLIDESRATIYNRLCQGLVPRATIVPAGVWAVHAVQERGFTLLQTSL